MLKIRNIVRIVLLIIAFLGFNALNAKSDTITEATPVYAAPVIASVPGVIASPTAPIGLIIPQIDLVTNIIKVGIAKDGKLDVPHNYTEVGWYKYGTLPGNVGSAVLDGHVDDGAAIPGPFKRLREVKEGDEIYVGMDNGQTLKYVVMNSSVYPTKKFPGEFIFHDKSAALLKIITCHGRFVKSENTYDQRLLVTAVLAEYQTI